MCNPVQEIKNLGNTIDEKIIQPIVQDPVEAIATATAYYLGGPIAAGATKTAFALDEGKDIGDALTEGATTAALAYAGSELAGGDGTYGGDVEAQPGGFYGETSAPVSTAVPVPAQNIQYPGVEVQQTYTPVPGSLQEALPSLGVETQASTAPFTAAPGSFPAAIAGGALTGATPAAATISIQNALRGANLLRSLNQTPQMQTPNLLGQAQKQLNQNAGVDYTSLLQLLSNKANTAGLLGTQFRPQSLNLTSLLG